MTWKSLVLIASLGSMALLSGAFAFQHLGGFHPCKMCLWQRWPHGAAVVIGVIALALPWRIWPLLGALAALITAGIGLFHAGVEQMWWEGPATCSGGSTQGLSSEALLEQILTAPVVRCDEIAWQFAGLSMAGWNMVLSLILAYIWLQASRRS